MTVLSRTNTGVSRLRRHRDQRPGRVAPAPQPRADRALTDPRTPGSDEITVRRRRREAGAPQDHAIYTCQCGYVFEAAVSTSVGCPHCGGAQAW